MGFTFFQDENGKDFFPVGLQAHNSSTGTELIEKTIRAVKAYGGNCLEAPVYWYRLEPEKDVYEMELVKELIDEVRAAGLKLIILWFGMSKNGHPNYVPEYVKLNPGIYRLVIGGTLPALSPHCEATLERDKKAFLKLMEFLKTYDEKKRTVLAVQIENEMGCAGTDRDYAEEAEADYQKPLPEELKNVYLEDDGRELLGRKKEYSPWKKQFGRYVHEAFFAWYHARYVGKLAEAGKTVYPIPLYTNVMVGENGFEEAGLCYNAGAAVGRVLDIWKAGAPSLDLICPDIYNENRREFLRICGRYNRPDNPLFIPESPIGGLANAMNAFLAVGELAAVGVCYFGAESSLDEEGELNEECRDMALTMKTIAAMAPLLIKYRKTGKKKTMVRGRALLIQTGDNEFFLAGAGIALDFIKRPDPATENSYRQLTSRYTGQLNFLSVEEGHFEGETWVRERYRNGDETNFSQYVLEGQIIRIRLNPYTGMEVVR